MAREINTSIALGSRVVSTEPDKRCFGRNRKRDFDMREQDFIGDSGMADMRTNAELIVNRSHMDPFGSKLRQIPISKGLVIERSSSGGSRAGSCERSDALPFAWPVAAASRS